MSLFIDTTAPNTLVTSVSLGEPKTNASGGKNVAVFDRENRRICSFVTPEVNTYGINENNFDAGKPPTYDITLQLDRSEKSMNFVQNVSALEQYIREQAFVNSRKWFGKQMSAEVINEFWTPFLRYPKKDKESGELDLSKSPTIRLKLSHFDGAFKYLEVYNVQNDLIFPKQGASLQELIPKGSEVKCLVRLNGIWFAGGKFGLTGKPIQIIVRPKARLMPGVCQMTMSSISSNHDQDEEFTEPMQTQSEELKVSVADSDDEDPDKEYNSTLSAEPVDTPEVAVPVKRRPRVKKEEA